MDVAAGTIGLLDVCFRVGKYLYSLKNSVADIEKDLTALQTEIDSIQSIYSSLDRIWLAHLKSIPGRPRPDSAHASNLWDAVGKNLSDAKAIVLELEALLKKIIGGKKDKYEDASSHEASSTTTKSDPLPRFDGLKRTLKLQFKEQNLRELQRRLRNCQDNLQILLIALNLLYTTSTHDSTDVSNSLNHLSDKTDEAEQLRSQLENGLGALKPRLVEVSGNDNLQSTINSAAAVVSSIRFNKHFYIPQNVSSIFTGRESLLEELKHAFEISSPLERNHTQRRFVIYGLGGSGKTQFCCKFAQDNRENFWAIFWIDGSSQESARHTFSDIANIGKVEPNERAAKSWLSSLVRPWLLIIDNADERNVSIEEYIPAGERGFILVTTRNPSNKVYGTLGRRFYTFERLETDEASDLLLKAAEQPSPWSINVRKSAASIATALGFLPLALLHAGKAIMDGLCSLDNYLDSYDRSWIRIRQNSYRTRENSQMTPDDRKVNMSIYSTYEIIYIGLEHRDGEDSRDAAELLKMFSFLYRENIEFSMLVAAATNPPIEKKLRQATSKEMLVVPKKHPKWRQMLWEWAITSMEPIMRDYEHPVLPSALQEVNTGHPFDEDRLRNALALLSQLGLTMHNPISDSYSIHPLVHIWARERPMTSTSEQAIWCQAATNVLARSILIQPPPDKLDLDEKLRRSLLPHVKHVRDCQQRIRSQLAENMEARKTRKRAWVFPLRIVPATFGRREAAEFTKFSLVYSKNGEWKTAAVLQEAVRDFLCAKLGSDHSLSIGITRLLVGTYFELSQNTKAMGLQTQVLKICLDSLGEEHPTTLKVKDTLASILSRRGQFNEAKKVLEEVVETMTRVLGPNHEDTLIARHNLGKALSNFFLHGEALTVQTDVHSRMTYTLGPLHLSTLNARESMAVAYLNLGHSKNDLQKALDLIEQVVCVNHGGVLFGRASLAQTLVRQGKFDEAESILGDVIERQKYEDSTREDGEHPDRILYLWMLLNCYDEQGKIEEAIAVGRELDGCVRLVGGENLGVKHPFAGTLREKMKDLRKRRRAIATI